MLGPPSNYALPPSPPYSGDDSPPPNISHLVAPNGLTTPERTPSSSSSFGNSPAPQDAGPSSMMHGNGTTRRQASTSDGSSKGSKKYVATLEDFQLIRVLGKGCAGRVLLVKHTPSNSIRAMKAISKRSVLTHDELNHTLTEQSILKKFAINEPNNRFISKLINSFTDRENFYFVMRFYPGGDLATQMEIWGILGDHRTRFYAADITQGLEDLHRHGIIVRDLKPENVLLNAKGHAVLADFGLSKEFSYRGDPKPIHVVTYPGQPELPPWAGQGAGSLRMLASGQEKLMIDKAYSFVGTSEYLSPEVVKRGDYSYAVDWWALGCIVLEGLVGRVPFRKADEDPPMVLWNKILFEPWDELFNEPKMARFIPDPVTYDFIDGLLQKDPMWRLTEPCVKQHDYFALLDWDTVKKGEYQDPHDLKLHPIAEYNTSYFPKLCLEEDPSVDMSTHDIRPEDDYKRTSLNDNALYALEQAKYREELEGFTWSREDDGYETETVEESELEESVAEEEEEEEDGEVEAVAEQLIGLGLGLEGKVPIQLIEGDPSHNIVEIEGVNAEKKDDQLVQPEEQRYKDEEDITIQASHQVNNNGVTDQTDNVGLKTPDKTDEQRNNVGSPESAYSNNLPAFASPLKNRPVVGGPGPEDTAVTPLDTASQQNTEESAPLDTTPGSTGNVSKPLLPIEKVVPLRPAVNVSLTNLSESQTRSPPLSPHSTKSHPVPIPLRPKPVRQLSEEVNLPPGLPSGGLSVSDIVSIPSQHPGSPSTRILRRHPQLPSVVTIPIARLSVELHGVRTHIDDEEWEELSISEGSGIIPTAQNGDGTNSHSFLGLGRVLKRRPSALMLGNNNGNSISNGIGGSGLKRRIKNSNTSSSNSNSIPSNQSSPTKSRPNLFSTKSQSNENKNKKLTGFKFGKINKKVFPKLKFSNNNNNNDWKTTQHSPLSEPPTGPNSNSAPDLPESKSITSSSINDNESNKSGNTNGNKLNRPSIDYRRHTESGLGWLRSKKKSVSISNKITNPNLNSNFVNIPKSSSSNSSIDNGVNSGPSSSIKKPISVVNSQEKDRNVSNSSSIVSITKDQKGLPKLDIELGELDWEPFSGKEWGVK